MIDQPELADDFAAAVSAALPARWRFPERVEGPETDWSDRVDAMARLLKRMEADRP